MAYIKRHLEEHVRTIAEQFPAVMVTGARQVGKSTMLGELFPEHDAVTFDDPILRAQAVRDPALLLMNHPRPVVLDEIQYVPELFIHLKMGCDSQPIPGGYVVTGSQPLRLMEKASESLAGRVGIVELPGVSLRELQEVSERAPFIPTAEYFEQRQSTVVEEADIWQRIHRGSYPGAQDDSVHWGTFYASYVQTYLERDVQDLARVHDKTQFTVFLQAIAARTGQMVNYENLASELGISAATIKSWVSVLEASGIVMLLQPFSNSALNRAIKTPKIYMRDTGLACYLTQWSNPKVASAGAMAGALFETYVVGEIVKSFLNAGIDYRFHLRYYRGKDRMSRGGVKQEEEVDLIISIDGINYPIEIKKSANPTPSMTAAFSVLDRAVDASRGTGTIICMYPKMMRLERDLFVCPPWWL